MGNEIANWFTDFVDRNVAKHITIIIYFIDDMNETLTFILMLALFPSNTCFKTDCHTARDYLKCFINIDSPGKVLWISLP